VISGPAGGLLLYLLEPQEGEISLRLRWRQSLGPKERGIFQILEEQPYLFSHLRPGARWAFPCFDEPHLAIPFSLELKIPKDLQVLGPSPIQTEREEGAYRWLQFEETSAISPRLLGLALGPLEREEAGGVGLACSAGKLELGSFLLAQAPKIKSALEALLKRKMPGKLDLLAIPSFGPGLSPGAGLLGVEESLILLDESRASPQRQRWAQLLLAQAMARQWFGVEIPLKSQEELWLQGALISWLAQQVLEPDPEGEMRQHSWTLRLDSLRRGPLKSRLDPGAGAKGLALMEMLEGWLGAKALLEVLANFKGALSAHSLFGALKGPEDQNIREILDAFIHAEGLPLIEAELECGEQPRVKLSQRPYHPLGQEVEPRSWHLPVCLRWGDAQSTQGKICLELQQQQQSFKLPSCPLWLHPNAEERGYYHWKLKSGLPQLLKARAALSHRERLGLLPALQALHEAGEIPVRLYLESLETLLKEPPPSLLSSLISELGALRERHPKQPGFASWFQKHLGPLLQGLNPKEEALGRQLRLALALFAEDHKLLTRAQSRAERFLRNPLSLSSKSAEEGLMIAAWRGDSRLWRRLRDALETAPDPLRRLAILRALGSFGDPQLHYQSLDLILDGPLGAEDLRVLLQGLNGLATREASWRWVTGRYESLRKRLGPESVQLPWLAHGFCSSEAYEEVSSFFSAPQRRQPGLSHSLEPVLESIARCTRLKAREESALSPWLKKNLN